MTQEYEFFKDFAGVTKADLEMFKCGGKKKKMQKGGSTPNKKNKTVVEDDPYYDDHKSLRVFKYPGTKLKNDSVTKETTPSGNSVYRVIKNGKESRPVPEYVYKNGPLDQVNKERNKRKK